uniref:Uncharacterized protein n=1 Tax=Callorhinchus milii TaxID=7868 RepID=A0A4W3IQE2_CALMI
MSDTEHFMGRLKISNKGIDIKSAISNAIRVEPSGAFHSIPFQARSVIYDIFHQGDLTFNRIRRKKDKIILAFDKLKMLKILQTPSP